MLALVNRAVGALVDGLLWPFQTMPLLGLSVASLLVAVIALIVFRLAVDPRRVTERKRQMQAGLFELRLFRDDPRLVLRVAAELLRGQLAYLRVMLWPFALLAVPLTLLLGQLDAHYGYEGLRPGESAVLKVRMAMPASADTPAKPVVALDAPDGLVVESRAVWAPALGELAWRIGATRDGDYELRIADGEVVMTKRVRVAARVVRRAAVRPSASLWSELRYPAEPPLPAGTDVDAIELTYPTRAIDVLGVSLPWIAVLLVLSTVFAVALRPVFGAVF